MCFSCLANRTTMPFTDLSETAAWKPTELMSNADYIDRLRKPRHPLVDSPFFDKDFVRIDTMHVNDLNGTMAIHAGSVLMQLVRSESRLGANQDAAVQT